MENSCRLIASKASLSRGIDTLEMSAKRVIFISSEGSVTEPDYFNQLNERLKKSSGVQRYLIKVLEHDGDGNSDPKSVLGLIEECVRIRDQNFLFPEVFDVLDCAENEVYQYFDHPESLPKEAGERFRDALTKAQISIGYYRQIRAVAKESVDDVFAVVLDRDHRSHTVETLAEVRCKCHRSGFLFCLTNPCFDFWLLLHLECLAETLSPDECALMLDNAHESNKHTFASKRLSALGQSGKAISTKMFDEMYYPNIPMAMLNVHMFATGDEDVCEKLGSSLPQLMSLLGF